MKERNVFSRSNVRTNERVKLPGHPTDSLAFTDAEAGNPGGDEVSGPFRRRTVV